ncbi:hypothetical protein [Duganella radicis]|uniref:Uncharacterized protein n=1 Tax=Duganella radicis TaxID=551988 RepID=A0A6L6PTC9_9BURK|nr:hypothetical protein [Duganella radicis]MTV41947.1 hypothetical protein [Duganella radicis]
MAALTLPAPLLMRLTVLRDQRPAMFQHALRTAMIAGTLAQRLKLPPAERPALPLGHACINTVSTAPPPVRCAT